MITEADICNGIKDIVINESDKFILKASYMPDPYRINNHRLVLSLYKSNGKIAFNIENSPNITQVLKLYNNLIGSRIS